MICRSRQPRWKLLSPENILTTRLPLQTMMTTRTTSLRQKRRCKCQRLSWPIWMATPNKFWINQSLRSNLLHKQIKLKINKLSFKKTLLRIKRSRQMMSLWLARPQALTEISPRCLKSSTRQILYSKIQTWSQKMKETLNSKVMKKWPLLKTKLTELMIKQLINSLKYLLLRVFLLNKMTQSWMMKVPNRSKSSKILILSLK